MCIIRTQFLLWFCIAKLSTAQLNGEFWWLNDKLRNYNNVKPPPPKFEDISEFDNDESARIVFRDSNLIANNITRTGPEALDKGENGVRYNKAIVWPVDREKRIWDKNIDTFTTKPLKIKQTKKPELPNNPFKFPEIDNVEKNDNLHTEIKSTDTSVMNNNVMYSENKEFENFQNKDEPITQNICTYMKKSECYQKNGFIQHTKFGKKLDANSHFICCVFSSVKYHEDTSSKIHFPDDIHDIKRSKRSDNSEYNLNQRKILLQRRENTQAHCTKSTMPPRIRTPDYGDDDPYWNIKTSVSKNDNRRQTSKKGYNEGSDEYVEDYAVEVPRPGLVGIHSDYGQNRPNNKYDGYDDTAVVYDDVDEDVDETGFGYSTADPRRVTKLKINIERGPDAQTFKPETQTISYYSKPDFNVLQGFKLKLFSNRNPLTKSSRKSTTIDDDINDDEKATSYDEDNDSDDHQVFPGCGQCVQAAKINKTENHTGEAVIGSQPWSALVVPTGNKKTILCYATLVHPRAAITAAHCVSGKSASEITVVTGIWDMQEMSSGESRVASVRIHPEYRHGNLSNDMALLYWNRSLELGTHIQPACLADPHLGDECMLFGWCGFDQALRRWPRWQKASVGSCKASVSLKNGQDLPDEAFCATVRSRSTVTGVGASLICNNDNGMSSVGVAVSRDTTLVLLPTHQWAISAIKGLKLNE